MAKFTLLEQFDYSKLEACPDWKQRFARYRVTSLLTEEDEVVQLAKNTVFSSLDAESGFWQIPLEEHSAHLTTFITPLGRYCFKWLPFGHHIST
ncbi:hypothetical protein QQF64_004529 [Cirrhinus molitorella]|uniref:ribonuclease H n=1 Tax=Cirrhinus molitorella TaxID=172907 RepID=A0ABR3MJM7_9TELE